MPRTLRLEWMLDWSLQTLQRVAFLVVVTFLFLAGTRDLRAQAQPGNSSAGQPEVAAGQQASPGDVIIDGQKVLSVYQTIGSYTPQYRADRITERIVSAAQEGVGPESIVLTPRDAWTEISSNGNLLLAVTDEDAKLAGITRAELAAEDLSNIREALLTYRREHNWKFVLRSIAYTLLTTLVLFPFAWILRRVRLIIRRRLEKWIERRPKVEERETFLHLSVTYAVSLLLALGTVLRWFALIALFEIYLTVVLGFYPQTRAVSHAVTGWILATLKTIGDSAIAYLPNLFVVAIIVIIASQVFRLIHMIFNAIGNGDLSIAGFYPEWAEPTAKLMRLLVMVLVVVIVFPYLPGSKSPAFQGISIFVGVLLSLGSSSAVANAIAGVILTYMRSFSIGDWVQIGDTVGEVTEKTFLVTRILTPKQETITIPNANVMGGSVMNYTREAKNVGVIFHTTVTIGYDVPWKQVHQLLIDAASATEHVLHDPAPFVLQTQLNDFYVSYELNAYTNVPRRMQFIYSELHQNIQDRFNEAGVEICSPHFASIRDGNTIAIPGQYIPANYKAPAFHIQPEEGEVAETVRKRD